MTAHPSHDDAHDVVEQFAAAYRCPDCLAEKALTLVGGVYVLTVRHHPTCPTLTAIRRSR